MSYSTRGGETKRFATTVLEFREGLNCMDGNRKKGICFPVKESVSLMSVKSICQITGFSL